MRLLLAGLKRPVVKVPMRDSPMRNELSSLNALVEAAKEAEALIDLLAGRTSTDTPSSLVPRDRERDSRTWTSIPSGPAHPRGSPWVRPPSRLTTITRSSTTARRTRAIGGSGSQPKGIPYEIARECMFKKACFECGFRNHQHPDCTFAKPGGENPQRVEDHVRQLLVFHEVVEDLGFFGGWARG